MLDKLNIKESVDLYRNKISLKEHTVDDYTNLIILLWNISFDHGVESYCISNNVFSENDIINFTIEVEELFNSAFNDYPDNKELEFWKMYIDELNSFSDCLHREKMISLLDDSRFLLPHFYLKVQCDIVNLSELKKLKFKIIKRK